MNLQVNLIPANDTDDDDDAYYDAKAHARDCQALDTDDLMLLVSERFSDSPALRALVDDTKRSPYAPGEPRRVHVSDAMRLAEALAAIVADIMDEQVELRLAGAEVPID